MKLMPLVVNTLALAALTGCIYESPEPCPAPVACRLTVRYSRSWEYAGADSLTRSWRAVWPSLGFTRTYGELVPALPDGLRTIVYDRSLDAVDVRNIGPSGGIVYFTSEGQALLVFNNDTEYDVIGDTGEADDAAVTTRLIERPGFTSSPYAKDAAALTTPPDVLYHAYLPDVEWRLGADTLTVDVTLAPLVYTYAVRCSFSHGIEYVALARGVLAGMAGGAWLRDGDPFERRVNVGFDAAVAPGGAVEAYVRSFGHPRGSEFDTYGLNLELRLTNGRRLAMDFDITGQMRSQPRGGVITVGGIDIPDSIGRQAGGGAFDVTVHGWDDFEDIPLPL